MRTVPPNFDMWVKDMLFCVDMEDNVRTCSIPTQKPKDIWGPLKDYLFSLGVQITNVYKYVTVYISLYTFISDANVLTFGMLSRLSYLHVSNLTITATTSWLWALDVMRCFSDLLVSTSTDQLRHFKFIHYSYGNFENVK